jgi:hypothetical protein
MGIYFIIKSNSITGVDVVIKLFFEIKENIVALI